MGGSFIEEIKQTDETANQPAATQEATTATPAISTTSPAPLASPTLSSPAVSPTEQVAQGNFCIHCGKTNPAGAVFCNQCGSKISE
jgi:hypothetical protein